MRAQVRAQSQYRISFWVDMVGSVVVSAMEVVAVLVLFRVTPALGGFSVRQVLVMTGLALTAFSLADLLVGNIDSMRWFIRTGRLDGMLIRPVRLLPQLTFGEISVRRLGRVVQGAGVLGIALSVADVHWTPARAALVAVAPLAGAVIFASVFVAASSVAFWFVESGEFSAAFTYGGQQFTLFPATIYPRVFRGVFAYGLGFIFVAYLPGLAILGKADPLGTPAFLAWCTPVVAAIAVCVAGLIWRTGVRHYRSTGS